MDYEKAYKKQDYSGLNDLERAIHRGFLVAGVENVPVTIIKETAQDCLVHIPAEWSEEDKDTIENAIKYLNRYSGALYNGNKGEESKKVSCIAKNLKSLRPFWKPSEEQMEALQRAIDACESEWAYQDDELRSLLNDIKKL